MTRGASPHNRFSVNPEAPELAFSRTARLPLRQGRLDAFVFCRPASSPAPYPRKLSGMVKAIGCSLPAKRHKATFCHGSWRIPFFGRVAPAADSG
jgi:hypothetical protein